MFCYVLIPATCNLLYPTMVIALRLVAFSSSISGQTITSSTAGCVQKPAASERIKQSLKDDSKLSERG